MKTSTGKFHKYTGLTLIEIMVAMAIGMLLMTGTASMFISNKRIYKEQDEMGRLQEDARFAMQILIEDIRMAGYAGCADDIDDIQNHVTGMTDDDELMSFVNAVEGLSFATGVAQRLVTLGGHGPFALVAFDRCRVVHTPILTTSLGSRHNIPRLF